MSLLLASVCFVGVVYIAIKFVKNVLSAVNKDPYDNDLGI